MKIEIFWRRNWLGKMRWYFRLVAANGEPIAQSEAYNQRQSCADTVALIKRTAASAPVDMVRS